MFSAMSDPRQSLSGKEKGIEREKEMKRDGERKKNDVRKISEDNEEKRNFAVE